jgi:two-component system response regulator NreC
LTTQFRSDYGVGRRVGADGAGRGGANTADVADALDTLSPREREVFRLLTLGHTNPEIAARLYLSVRTVESHRASLQQKLGLGSRAELVDLALRRGLLVAPQP